MHAYRTVNKSSMGAAALTTSGFPLSRERMKELLAFDDIVENAYDAVAGADYLGETAAAVHVAATNLGRAIQDLLLWCTQEFAVLRVADPYVQASSIMPQKRNPVSLEHLRSLLSSAAGNAATVLTMMHNTPFGDIVDTEDDMQPYVWRSLSLLEQLYRLLACVIATLEVDRQRLLERARQSFATLTELADTLVRTDNLPFRKAHQIVSRVGREAMRLQLSADQLSLDLLNQVAQEVIGRRLQLSAEQLRQALDPLHFVTVRTLPGGPNPEVVKRMIAERRKRLGAIAEWVGTTRQTIAQAQRSLDQVVEGWSEAR
jgi:argininosuccinate lyase